MTLKALGSGLSVSPQILADDIRAVAAAGFRSVICNRPGGEGADQPPFAEIEAAARAAGPQAACQPVVSGQLADADTCHAPDASTAAAARKQAPIVAHDLLKELRAIDGADAAHDGSGSCPLTVERGRLVLAEFGYGGRRLPSFPAWLIDDMKSSHLAWLLKERMLPTIHRKAMLRGKEWMAKPQMAG